jgi:hypothetical protein
MRSSVRRLRETLESCNIKSPYNTISYHTIPHSLDPRHDAADGLDVVRPFRQAGRPLGGRWGKCPALSAVMLRCHRPPTAQGPTCRLKAKNRGLPAARAIRAQSPVEVLFGAETGATRMGQEFGERKEPTGALPLVDCDLSGNEPVGEDELRALEILLGESLKKLLSGGAKTSPASAASKARSAAYQARHRTGK